MAADPRASATLANAFFQALLSGALPGETEGFTAAEQAEAAAFIAEAATLRRPGEIALTLQSVGGEAARRLMRLVIVNDDMPFLVDSVAAVIAGHSHRPTIAWRGPVLHLNPGSAGPRRFRLPVSVAAIEVEAGGLQARIVELDCQAGQMLP